VLQYSDLSKPSLNSGVPKQSAANRESDYIDDRHSTVAYVSWLEISSGNDGEGEDEDGNIQLHTNEEDTDEDNESEEEYDGNDGVSVINIHTDEDTSHHPKADWVATTVENEIIATHTCIEMLILRSGNQRLIQRASWTTGS